MPTNIDENGLGPGGRGGPPLASEAAGERLHARGIAFAPDEISGAGALLLGAVFHLEGRRPSEAEIALQVGERTAEILARAEHEGVAPSLAAARLAEHRLRERASAEVLESPLGPAYSTGLTRS